MYNEFSHHQTTKIEEEKALSRETSAGYSKRLLKVHWWRVVLDESQRVPKPAGAPDVDPFLYKAGCAA